ncbi:2-succinyl-6-hydroxy-2, 4-cyclohexadiene-1-carboxylate synthase [Paraliobacillus sp. PM-2]|uniref:2-succinyl-6-hydroxy-2, 4-cyclohexadiene-1-carboxylate synthase n=1 Tax=Paraliobacillus sp. PM-2 TaxID=1462524 RepID=UPI00061C3669|nr:2-succinyl-6-hydroxy-2,4-cyclohexadiene-1-carboxylate synthase [Paraliobacillus sp. PM-2]CQR48206.1 2-succinyl-6-hydroxy-2, 4-cyclohexadiene-1-carboxylate synthase [Paraliobacillus sp. PM-2]
MYLKTTNCKYWVETFGEQRGIPIVFLHGFTGTNKTWEQIIAMLARSHWCVSLDLPGHGKSKMHQPMRMEMFCDDLGCVLDQLQIDQVHLVGYSMGGRAALSFTILHPSRVRTLTLESASPGLDSPDEQLARQTKDEALAERVETEGVVSFVDYWEDLPLFSSQKKLTTTVRDRIRNERLSQSASGLAASLRGMGTGVQPSWWDKLATVAKPILLIVGELDEKFVILANEMKQQCQHAELAMVSNAGHAVHVEQREKFDTIVNDFIIRMEEQE